MEAVQHGGIYDEVPTRTVRLSPSAIPPGLAATRRGDDRYPLTVFPHPALHDGRGANKPWLEGLPDPVSRISWHGWVEVNPETAGKWQVASGDIVLLTSPYGARGAPVWITPSVMPGVLAVPTGQGHPAYGRYARDRSFNAFQLLGDSPAAYGGREFLVSVTVAKTGDHRRLATAEGNAREQGEGIIEALPLAKARQLRAGQHPVAEKQIPDYAEAAREGWAEAQHEKASLGNYAGAHPRWAMAIDLAKCTGCSRSEEHTSELQSQSNLVCRLLLEKKKKKERKMACEKKKSCTAEWQTTR